ncbi:methionyl-tRNA formyltransferase [Anaerotignum neopropionicum]|uniref:Methionyl-tRNA formyltransferase n=1 Tax=Anaerotignum neopropionicum TaxID=36847 RepID=A0A136WB29_9FIRM|nr:methionyl-tRNA formyltransferase [Anaerotignum neopropionicum]KXL51730.1 methionyl-tRNA formyltransferase [Anaerotignum neopropionicum]
MRVIFMGTPDFAVYSLKALLTQHEVIAVVSQPDKPKGRGKKLVPTPVKEFALAQGLQVFQPEKARDLEFVALLKELNPDVIAVTAFGQLLPESILNIPQYGCINVHGSLLPKYRGAAPMQWAIINGEKVTGITTMFMAKGMDTGDMLLKTEVKITPQDNFASIHDKMAQAGAGLLLETLDALQAGTVERVPQDHEAATYAPMITKETGHIDWTKSAWDIINLMRGLDPAPGAYAICEGEPLKLFKGMKAEGDYRQGKPGEVIDITKKGFVVKCGDGALTITELQAMGKKRMPADAYLRGHAMNKGVLLQ